MILRCTLPIIHTRVIGQSDLSISFLSLTTVEYLCRDTLVNRVTVLWYTIKHTGIFLIKRLNLISLILSPCMSGFIVDLMTSCVGSTNTKRSSSSVRLEFIHRIYFPFQPPSHPSTRSQSRSSNLNVYWDSFKFSQNFLQRFKFKDYGRAIKKEKPAIVIFKVTYLLIMCFHPSISTSVLPLLILIEMWTSSFYSNRLIFILPLVMQKGKIKKVLKISE